MLGAKQAQHTTQWPYVHGTVALIGIWQRAEESEISATCVSVCYSITVQLVYLLQTSRSPNTDYSHSVAT